MQATYLGDQTLLSSVSTASFVVRGPPWYAKLTYYTTLGSSDNYGVVSFRCGIYVWDSAINPLPGITVNFTGAGLQFSPSPAITDSSGSVLVTLTPLMAGNLSATATVVGYDLPFQIPAPVAPAPLTVTATINPTARFYGAANPIVKNTVSGLVGSETVTVTNQFTANPTSPPGTYPITTAVSGPKASNYAVTILGANLTVTKAPLIVIARSVASTYGKTPAPPTGYVLSGFVNGDTASGVSGAPVLSTTVTATTPAGAYPIGVQLGTLTAANYTFKTTGAASGSVQVYKAPLTVSANHITMKAGSAVPPLTYTLTGFANGETSSVVSGVPVLNTSATSASKPGNYPITVAAGTLGAANYSFTPVNGSLTVTP